jgi:hypothetical protein
MLTILITIIAIIGWIGCVYYYGKAKENGHLFELSKGYYQYEGSIEINPEPQTKLNKDGSIAKKRGRKSNVKTT